MKFIHRLAYYLGGFAIGLIILAFFLSGKKTTCDYSPDARVLKNIRIKERNISTAALESMKLHKLDSTHISEILKTGNVDFSRSNTKTDPCKTYFIDGRISDKQMELLVENCDSIATIQSINLKE